MRHLSVPLVILLRELTIVLPHHHLLWCCLRLSFSTLFLHVVTFIPGRSGWCPSGVSSSSSSAAVSMCTSRGQLSPSCEDEEEAFWFQTSTAAVMPMMWCMRLSHWFCITNCAHLILEGHAELRALSERHTTQFSTSVMMAQSSAAKCSSLGTGSCLVFLSPSPAAVSVGMLLELEGLSFNGGGWFSGSCCPARRLRSPYLWRFLPCIRLCSSPSAGTSPRCPRAIVFVKFPTSSII